MENKWLNCIQKPDAITNEQRNHVKRLFLNVLRENGYAEIDLPTLDYSEAYIVNNDYASAQNHFKTVAPNGEVLALGDDLIKGLISYSRSILEKKGKICGQMDAYSFLRETEDGCGYQAGGIFFGAEGVEEEADLIAAGFDFAQKIGIENPRIKLGNTDVFKGVLNGFAGKNESLLRLREILNGNLRNEVDYATSQTLSPIKNVDGNATIIKDLATKLNNQCSLDGLLDLFEVMNVLEVYGIDSSVSVVPGYTGEREYDSGVVFAVESEDGKRVCYGGRCDCMKGSDRVCCLYVVLDVEKATEAGKNYIAKSIEDKRVSVAVAETRAALAKSRKLRKDLMQEGIMTDMWYNATEKTVLSIVEKHRERVVIYIDEEGNITHS